MTKVETQHRTDITLAGVPEGLDALVLAQLAREAGQDGTPGVVLHVARDDRRAEALETALAFFASRPRVAPGTPQGGRDAQGEALRVISFPAWDTVPYDRVGPNPDIVARRITALARLVVGARKEPTIVVTTVNAVLQRLAPRAFIRSSIKQMAPGQRIDMARLARRLSLAGYVRTGTVMEPGEYAIRGGILDLFPPGRTNPVRLDFFGDTLESIKSFDAETQRTTKPIQKLGLLPISEVALGEEATGRFRTRYVELFGGSTGDDPLYEAVSAGQRYPGQEHWLPLFHDTLETLLDYLPGAWVSFDHGSDEGIRRRFELIDEHYQARLETLEVKKFGAPVYKPAPPDRIFLAGRAWARVLAGHPIYRLEPFEPATSLSPSLRGEGQGEGRPRYAAQAAAPHPSPLPAPSAGAPGEGASIRSWRGKQGRSFAPERQNPDANLFDAVVGHVRTLIAAHRRVIVACWTPGARERMATLLADHGLKDIAKVDGYREALSQPGHVTSLAVLGLEQGFETPELAVIAEQDILGDRLVRPRKKHKRAADVLTEATSMSVGDLVVHADHGIGRFAGLQTITALGAPHDCLELHYAGGDKLFLPVENIELLSRYGSEDGSDGQLDRLGGVAWQSRKARLKKRLREIASELIKVAALRQLKEAPVVEPPHGAYDEFVARFPYEETEDQAASIEAVIADLGLGRPMDRLVCGDVGFGKTEVALRAAFVAALNGLQVAVVVPTTLLARQHFKTFSQRFAGLPVKVAQASRLVGTKELADVKQGLKAGTIDIVVGTHALLSKQIEFARLGLLIIDEEQHFGVAHKERLKALREDVHVLTLSATPIPRALLSAPTSRHSIPSSCARL